MSGNVRRAKRKNKSGTVAKPEYVSYRCGCRKTKSTVVCDNSEIGKEYLEEYVVSELEKMLVSDGAIEKIVDEVNGHLNKVNADKDEIIERLESAKKDTQKSIDNIINAVTMGFASADLKVKLDNLNEKKAELELKIEQTKTQSENSMVVGSDVRKALKNLRHFLLVRDLVEVKKFMKIFVKSIVKKKRRLK